LEKIEREIVIPIIPRMDQRVEVEKMRDQRRGELVKHPLENARNIEAQIPSSTQAERKEKKGALPRD